MNRRNLVSAEIGIIGAGPIGLELAINLKNNGYTYFHFDAAQIGNTISRWPENTQFYSAPERVAIGGIPIHTERQVPLTKDAYLAYLRQVVEGCNLKVNTYEKVMAIQKTHEGFVIETNRKMRYAVSKVVLATGDMSFPNKIDIPGASQEHVHFELKPMHTYFGKKVLLVGGKNSALEASIRAYRIGAEVILSYRGKEFDSEICKPHLLAEINMLIDREQINFIPESNIKEIRSDSVVLDAKGAFKAYPTDFVVFRIGYQPDFTLFKRLNVELEGDEKVPTLDSDTMESNVPGVYVAGTIAGGSQQTFNLFIDTCHEHIHKIMKALDKNNTVVTGSVASRNYSFHLKDIQKSSNGK